MSAPTRLAALRKLPPVQIAASIALREAAGLTTPRAQDVPIRIANAHHEATHMVVAAAYGIRTSTVVVPVRDGRGALKRRGLYSVGDVAGMTIDGLSPDNPMDWITHLQEAAVDFSGEVAEGINGTINWCPLPAFREMVDDTTNGVASTRSFLFRLRKLTTDPGAWPHIKQWCNSNPYDGRKLPTEDEDRQGWVNILKRDALALVASNFELIDAVAAVVLIHAEPGGEQHWSYDAAEWLHQQTRLPATMQDSAERDCEYEFPEWLRPYLRQRLYPFYRLRTDLAALEASIPVVAVEELLAGMDFQD